MGIDDISFFEFRRLVTNFDKVYGKMSSPTGPNTLDAGMREYLMQYLNKVDSCVHMCNDALAPI